MTVDYDKPEDLLDVGSSLKKEKTFKENQEKIAKLKEEYQKQQGQKKTFNFSFVKYKSLLFLLLIIVVAVGIRLYVASMPLTEQWAEQVVEANLKVQVSNRIAEQYPSLSDVMKGELIIQGTQQALATEQNQNAITALEQEYKASYQDPQGNTYLYEIDPYYFYEQALKSNILKDSSVYPGLPFFENMWYVFVAAFIPSIEFIKAIFYIPLLFTILSAICLWYIGKKIWTEEAGVVAALLFVCHPILLEYSILGFVDTNMLNIFFILASSVGFILFSEAIQEKKYWYAGAYAAAICVVTILFRYTWSAWYISLLLIVGAICSYSLFIFCKKLYSWKQQKAKTRYLLIGILFCFLIGIGLLSIVLLSHTFQNYIPENVKMYLQIETENQYGLWPDAFSLIKELQNNLFTTTVGYLGKLFFLVFSVTYILLTYKTLKEEKISGVYLSIATLVFAILAFKIIRLMPYFIAFFALFFGAGFSYGIGWISKKLQELFFPKERASILITSSIILYILIAIPFVYPLAEGIHEKSKIIPIMDDAIYNSAMFIKDNSSQESIISTWWDRGTFYKTLSKRAVHLQSAPHMPRTYWLAVFYTTSNPREAKNIQELLNCQDTANFPQTIPSNLSKKNSINEVRTFLSVNSSREQEIIIQEFSEDDLLKKYFMNFVNVCTNHSSDTYIVVIDDLMSRFSGVQSIAAWNFDTQQPDPKYPYNDLEAGGCSRTQNGVYCTVSNANFYVNLTNMEWKDQLPVQEVFVVANNTVQHNTVENQIVEKTLIIYQRADQWKALYLPKEVADSMYVRLMILDAYDAPEFEKVFDEVHTETSWVKVYKIIS